VGIASRSPERVAAAVERLRSHGGRAEGWSADVRDADSIGAALAAAHEAFGPIDVLVSGAAGNFVAPALGMSSKGFRTVVDIDLVGTFNVLRGAHEFLRRPGASVINISAPQAANPTAYQAHVCAAKAGVDMLTRVLAMEWGVDGVRVNSIVPGPIGDTEGVRRLAPGPEALAAMAASIPHGRRRADGADAELALVELCHGRCHSGGRRQFAGRWTRPEFRAQAGGLIRHSLLQHHDHTRSFPYLRAHPLRNRELDGRVDARRPRHPQRARPGHARRSGRCGTARSA
jgi:NAD(P)-dependent dehydrogenase (short-subunit alcohol dehydrogenase family)